MTFKYQIGLAGHFNAHQARLESLLYARTDELGVDRTQIVVVDDLTKPDVKSPLVVVFFGYGGAQDSDNPALASLLTHSITVLPCVEAGTDVTSALPPYLRHINALSFEASDASFARLVSLILENLRLLRSERRLFISYRRAESQSIAIQLYERLDAAGFDVFLDTRSVPYGTDFQGILWHRMADSDVVYCSIPRAFERPVGRVKSSRAPTRQTSRYCIFCGRAFCPILHRRSASSSHLRPATLRPLRPLVKMRD